MFLIIISESSPEKVIALVDQYTVIGNVISV